MKATEWETPIDFVKDEDFVQESSCLDNMQSPPPAMEGNSDWTVTPGSQCSDSRSVVSEGPAGAAACFRAATPASALGSSSSDSLSVPKGKNQIQAALRSLHSDSWSFSGGLRSTPPATVAPACFTAGPAAALPPPAASVVVGDATDPD